MIEKTYLAKGFDEALALAKAELGPEALIVSSRSLPPGESGMDRLVELKAALQGEPSKVPTEQLLWEKRLSREGVSSTLARRIAQHVCGSNRDKPTLFRLGRALSKEISFSGPIDVSQTRVVVAVGPTGVGKTTTLAKLAAHFSLVEGHSVACISMDDFRVAGAEQLNSYADLIGVPFEAVSSDKELEHAMRRFASHDLILIDTAGRSPGDHENLVKLSQTLRRHISEGYQTHLCLAPTMRDKDLQRAIDQHSVLSPSHLIFTKLDESSQCGSVINTHRFCDIPLSYFTDGQRVPEDMTVASVERLAMSLWSTEVFQ